MDRPLRVAFVSHHPHLQMGGQRSMALLIEHLDARAVEPLVICPGPGPLTDHLTRLGCPVVHIPLHRIKPRTLAAVWRSSRAIRALLRERGIDILAPDAARDALTCGLAKLGTGTRMVWFVRLTSHDPLDPILVRLADAMIGDSDDTLRRFGGSKRAAAIHRTIVGGADLRRFRPADDRAALRRSLNLPLDRPVLAFVGQVKAAKGVLDIVDALGTLHANGPGGPAPVLLVIGTPDPPAILEEIDRRSRAHGIAQDVRVLPQQADIERWMQAADLLLSGSHQDTEGMSRVLYEAMACGAVPVATDIRGNRDALTPDCGVLVPERDPAAMAQAWRALLADPARLAALRAGGIARARASFDIRRHARAVEAFYREVVA
ncbi:MAG TPA: glycosyltransferase [Gemmatimonadales bacterium]|nr:glycosyltransferase [Gemmatimonadales bacterium]